MQFTINSSLIQPSISHSSSTLSNKPITAATNIAEETLTNIVSEASSGQKRSFSKTRDDISSEKASLIYASEFSNLVTQSESSIAPSLKEVPFRTASKKIDGYWEYKIEIEMGLDVLPSPSYFSEDIMELEKNKHKEIRDDVIEISNPKRLYIENLYFPSYRNDRVLQWLLNENDQDEIKSIIKEVSAEAKRIVLEYKFPQTSVIFSTLRRHLKGTSCDVKKMQNDAIDILNFVVCFRHAKEKLFMLHALANHFALVSDQISKFDSKSNNVVQHVRLKDLDARIYSRATACSITSLTGPFPLALRNYHRGHILPLSCFTLKLYSDKPVAHLNPLNITDFNSYVEYTINGESRKIPLYAFLNRTEIVHRNLEHLNSLLENELRVDCEKILEKILLAERRPSELVRFFASYADEILSKTKEGDALHRSAFLAGIEEFKKLNPELFK